MTHYYYNGAALMSLTRGTDKLLFTYDTWGKAISTTGTLAGSLGNLNPFRYRGYVYDTETGLYYLQTRYYDPEVGRFINADGYLSTGQGILGKNMYSYCGNNPVNMVDEAGSDPVPIWAKQIVAGTATEAEYAKALSVNASAWTGSAGYTVRMAVSLAHEHQAHLMAGAAAHQKKGTTNKANKQKHEAGQARKQRDNNGEKGDARRQPNPNKRRRPSSEINIGVGERIVCGLIVVGATVGVIYLVANDATIIGVADDAAIAPLLPIIWDNVEKIFS